MEEAAARGAGASVSVFLVFPLRLSRMYASVRVCVCVYVEPWRVPPTRVFRDTLPFPSFHT